MAAEIAAPLSKTEEIVLLGDDRITGEVSRLIGQLPPAVQALTGVDLSKVIIHLCACDQRFGNFMIHAHRLIDFVITSQGNVCLKCLFCAIYNFSMITTVT